jgi:uncharacterized membrane protein
MHILIAGESWTVHSIHQKGFDSFTTTDYAEGVEWLRSALESHGHTVDFQPSHVASRKFPSTVVELQRYDCVVLSDIGANTLLLHPETFSQSRSLPNRLWALREYVLQGGGLVMIGGYMTFQGIEGKARYHGTPVEEVLPVLLEAGDDRVEAPEGLVATVELPEHEIVQGIVGAWPALLGLNAVHVKGDSELIATAGGYPLLVAGVSGKGRSVAFTSDCSPHWAPAEFLAWEHYDRLWAQIVEWCGVGDAKGVHLAAVMEPAT